MKRKSGLPCLNLYTEAEIESNDQIIIAWTFGLNYNTDCLPNS